MVIGSDGVETWETALVVRSARIAHQLHALAVPAPAVGFARALPIVSAFVLRQVGYTNARYKMERVAAGGDALPAVLRARAALEAIGRVPAVRVFLARGVRVEEARFRTACQALAALLDASDVTTTNAPRSSRMDRCGGIDVAAMGAARDVEP